MKYWYFFIFPMLFLGCMKVGPNYQSYETIKYPKFIKKDLKAQQELATWWNIFHDKTLNTLIQKGFENNLDIKQAGLRILQARTLLGVSKGFTYPQVQTLQGTLLQTRQKNQNITTADLNFDLGWEIDFWGKYARGIESAQAGVYLSIASYESILSTIMAEIARNYINYQIAQERIIYAKRNIAIQEKIVHITQIQFNAGNVSELDMQQAKTQLFSTKAKLPALELAKQNALNALALLIALPKEEVEQILQSPKINQQPFYKSSQTSIEIVSNNMTKLSLIPQASLQPKTKISIAVLKHRPDIQVAEFQAKQACAEIGIKQAQLYPSFSLLGNIGINAIAVNGSWSSFDDAFSVSAGPGFNWQILQYGRIKNQIRFQDARYEEALLGYNKALLQAINEVSNAIDGYMLTKEQLLLTQQTIKATTRAFNLSAQQYSNGLVSYQRLLSTVEKLTYSQDFYAQIKGNLALEAVLLYKALGGGWQKFINYDYIDNKTKHRLQQRGVNWGDYLNDTRIKHD